MEGVLCLRFSKVGSTEEADGPVDASFVIEIDKRKFNVTSSRRGGAHVFDKEDGKSSNLAQVEKLVTKWGKSLQDFKSVLRTGLGGAVRLKLAPLASIEGVSVPAALARMDLQRVDRALRAKEELKGAARRHRLKDLREAVAEAVDADIEDETLGSLQETGSAP